MQSEKREKSIRGGTSKLQAEIDALLSDMGHLFDDLAEYSADRDPINLIDIG